MKSPYLINRLALLCLALFLFLSLGVTQGWAHTRVAFDVTNLDPDSRTPIWPHLETLADASGHFDVAAANGHFERLNVANESSHLTSANQHYGRWIPYPYWARFELKNSSEKSKRFVLSLESPTQDDARLWMLQTPRVGELGIQVVPQRDAGRTGFGQGLLYPAWAIELAPGQQIAYVLRIDGLNLMRFPLMVSTEESFDWLQGQLKWWIGFVLAIPVVVMLYMTTLFRRVKDRSVPLFFVMATFELVGACWISGFLHSCLPWLDRWQAGRIGLIGYGVALAITALHAQAFLQTRSGTWAHRALWGLAAFWSIGLALTATFAPDATRLHLLYGGTLHATIMSCLALWHWSHRDCEKPDQHLKLFIAVWAVYLSSSVVYILYRIAEFPVHVTLICNFVQGAVVAALLGWSVAVQVHQRQLELEQQIMQSQARIALFSKIHNDLMQPFHSLGVAIYTQLHPPAPLLQSFMTDIYGILDALRPLSNDRNPSSFDLNQHVQQLLPGYLAAAEQKNMQFRVHPLQITLWVDEPLFSRLLVALLSNAVRSLPRGTRLLLCKRRIQGQWWLFLYSTNPALDAYAPNSQTLNLALSHFFELSKTLQLPTQLQLQGLRSMRLGVRLPVQT